MRWLSVAFGAWVCVGNSRRLPIRSIYEPVPVAHSLSQDKNAPGRWNALTALLLNSACKTGWTLALNCRDHFGQPVVYNRKLVDRSRSGSAVAQEAEERWTGVAKFFHTQKGWGYIVMDNTGEDIFVHNRDIHAADYRSLMRGEPVEFAIGWDEQKGMTSAVNVTGPGGAFVKTASWSDRLVHLVKRFIRCSDTNWDIWETYVRGGDEGKKMDPARHSDDFNERFLLNQDVDISGVTEKLAKLILFHTRNDREANKRWKTFCDRRENEHLHRNTYEPGKFKCEKLLMYARREGIELGNLENHLHEVLELPEEWKKPVRA